jgi:hypothetical protein
MNKAILVIDMPSCCNECSLIFEDEYSYFCPVKCEKNKTDLYENYIRLHRKPDWCPLKPFPDKRYESGTWILDGYINDGYSQGWNDCIEEILGK